MSTLGRVTAVMLALIASGTLAAAPALAAIPPRAQGTWLPLCGGAGTYWRFVPIGSRDRAPARRNDPAPLCAHLPCAREQRGDGKARI